MKIEQFSFPIWLIKNGIKNEKNEQLEFNNHLFLYQIARDFSKKQVIKKAAQIGMSVLFNLKAFYMAKYGGMNLIYTMPSDSDVEEFAKTKTDRIFQSNECIRKYIKVDNVTLKQIGERFLYFKGTRSKAAPISTTADALLHDELDRSDMNIVEIYQSRISASQHKYTWYFSNPSLTKVGVDLYWQQSDKHEWFITCTKCKDEQILSWEDNVDTENKIYVCRSCNAQLTDKDRKLGVWKPTSQGEWRGYHVSQLMAPWVKVDDLIKQKEQQGIEYFRNFVLGEPYSPGDSIDFRQAIMDNWSAKPLDNEPFFMGIDVGKEKHWVLGSQRGIFKIGVCESRQELESVIDKYNPVVVIDSGPERTWVEEFRLKYPKLFICFYQHDKNIAEMIRWGGMKGSDEDKKNWGYVWIDRNRVIDLTVQKIASGELEFDLPREDLEKVIQHWENRTRIEEEVKSLRTKRYIWDRTGPDHFAAACHFYVIATQRIMEPVIITPEGGDHTKAFIYEHNKMRNLEEVFNEMNE